MLLSTSDYVVEDLDNDVREKGVEGRRERNTMRREMIFRFPSSILVISLA